MVNSFIADKFQREHFTVSKHVRMVYV